jgi:hypothetical protein
VKFTIELTKSQYNKLVKRSEMLGQQPQDAAKMVLSVLTDGSDKEFIDYLELTGTHSVHRSHDIEGDIAQEWEYNDDKDIHV